MTSGTKDERAGRSVRPWVLPLVALAAALVITVVLGIDDGEMGGWWWSFAALALVLIGVVVLMVFHAAGATKESRRRRIAVLTLGATVGVLTVTQLVLSANDQVRETAPASCESDDEPHPTTETSDVPVTATSEPASSTASTSQPGGDEASEPEASMADSASESTESTESTVPASTAPAPGDDLVRAPSDGTPHLESFGVERVVRTEQFAIAVAGDDTLSADDFAVFSDDGRTARQFGRVAGVEEYGEGDWRVRVEFDLRCYSPWEGGSFPITVVYRGDASVAPERWDATVELQSRLVAYGFAALPWTIIGAIYVVFDVWPLGLKRWVGTLVAVGTATVGAYATNGLRNGSWQPTAFSVGALLAVSWAAATAAAVVAKKGGYDLGDRSSVAEVEADEITAGGGGAPAQ